MATRFEKMLHGSVVDLIGQRIRVSVGERTGEVAVLCFNKRLNGATFTVLEDGKKVEEIPYSLMSNIQLLGPHGFDLVQLDCGEAVNELIGQKVLCTYNGGSKPGALREVAVLARLNDSFIAVLHGDKEKTYDIHKMSRVQKLGPHGIEYMAVRKPLEEPLLGAPELTEDTTVPAQKPGAESKGEGSPEKKDVDMKPDKSAAVEASAPSNAQFGVPAQNPVTKPKDEGSPEEEDVDMEPAKSIAVEASASSNGHAGVANISIKLKLKDDQQHTFTVPGSMRLDSFIQKVKVDLDMEGRIVVRGTNASTPMSELPRELNWLKKPPQQSNLVVALNKAKRGALPANSKWRQREEFIQAMQAYAAAQTQQAEAVQANTAATHANSAVVQANTAAVQKLGKDLPEVIENGQKKALDCVIEEGYINAALEGKTLEEKERILKRLTSDLATAKDVVKGEKNLADEFVATAFKDDYQEYQEASSSSSPGDDAKWIKQWCIDNRVSKAMLKRKGAIRDD